MRVTANNNVLFHQYGEEAVLLNLDTESYFSLNETAIRMWELLTTRSFDDAAMEMAAEYDAPVEIIREDMTALIESLKRANLVTVSEGAV